ncbi:bifunctional serine/threonine-protein kinase/ABC transporter substrate-binding protein [Streptomyces mesophilus]|uniref:bifunctional serine/threonine-protein kinase/ABC transporter substrate-binding protein n=1 Tax=Streptomyces mesophilus TaxID=1775132 RepID=UPI00332EE6B6
MTRAVEPLLPSDPSSLAGHRLLGRLGAGGMGVVYLGRTESGALAAVKVIQAEYARDEAFRARFRREIEAARRVTSRWSVPLTGADAEAEQPWLATAFVAGPSLAEAVEACGPLPERSVRALGSMLASALTAVHTAGLVHRDVKPGNVLLAVDGPRLIDFGIARTADGNRAADSGPDADDTALTATDLVVGTPGFLAPEQAQGGELGPPADAFALGGLLAYAATGRPPFGTGTPDALLYRTVHDEPDLDGVSAALHTLLSGLLAKDPADRTGLDSLVEDTPADDWLPDTVVRLVADRAAALLALPGIEQTQLDASELPTQDAPSAERPSSRRKFLLISGAAVLAAGGGVAAWAASITGSGPEDPVPEHDRWHIGLQADLSGPHKAAGRAQEEGARLAVEQFNSRKNSGKNSGSGKQAPFEVGLVVRDDGGDPARAARVAKDFTLAQDILAVIGPTTDDTARAVLKVYDESYLAQVAVSPGAMDLTVPSLASRSLLQARPLDAHVAQPYAALAAAAGVKVLGLVQDRTVGVLGWETAAITTSSLRGTKIAGYPRVVPAHTKEFEPVVADMLDAGCDGFVFAGGPDAAAVFARELAAAGFDGLRLAPQSVLDPRFLKDAGEAAEGWQLTASFVDPAAVPELEPFTKAFTKRYGRPPGYQAAEAYDAVNLIIEGLLATGRKRPAREALTRRLRKSTYKGLTKTHGFDPEVGSFTQWSVHRYEVAGGRFQYAGAVPPPPSD